MSNELSGYSINQPLQSAPLTGEVMAVDTENRVCTVQVQSQVVDNVTWFGIEPLVGEIVYLTDAGDRMIAVAAGDADHSHPEYGSASLIVDTVSGTSTTKAPSQNAVYNALLAKAPSVHSHDDRYYTESEINNLLFNRPAFKYGRAAQGDGTGFPIGENASTGDIVIAHQLGRSPYAVFVCADDDGGDASVFASVRTWDATYIYAKMRNIGAAESHVFINWIAF